MHLVAVPGRSRLPHCRRRGGPTKPARVHQPASECGYRRRVRPGGRPTGGRAEGSPGIVGGPGEVSGSSAPSEARADAPASGAGMTGWSTTKFGAWPDPVPGPLLSAIAMARPTSGETTTARSTHAAVAAKTQSIRAPFFGDGGTRFPGRTSMAHLMCPCAECICGGDMHSAVSYVRWPPRTAWRDEARRPLPRMQA